MSSRHKKNASSKVAKLKKSTRKSIKEIDNENEKSIQPKKQSEFLCSIKYKNRLPEPAMITKIMKYNYNINNITEYNQILDYSEFNMDTDMLLSQLNFIDLNELGPTNGKLALDDHELITSINNNLSSINGIVNNSKRQDIHKKRKDMYKQSMVMLRKPHVESKGNFISSNAPIVEHVFENEEDYVEESFNIVARLENELKDVESIVSVFPLPDELLGNYGLYFSNITSDRPKKVNYLLSDLEAPHNVEQNIIVTQDKLHSTVYEQNPIEEEIYDWNMETESRLATIDHSSKYFLTSIGSSTENVYYGNFAFRKSLKKRMAKDSMYEDELRIRPKSLKLNSSEEFNNYGKKQEVEVFNRDENYETNKNEADDRQLIEQAEHDEE